MAKPARIEPVTDLPPPVLLVARAQDSDGSPCVAAVVVRGKHLQSAVVLERCQEAATADRSWREWAWRLLYCNEAVPAGAPARLRSAKGLGLAKGGRAWGVCQVSMDREGLEPSVLDTAETKVEAWEALERQAALHLLDDERRRYLRHPGGSK